MIGACQTVNMLQTKQCEICNTVFTRKTSLKRHMLKQHSNKELPKSYIMSTNPSQDADHGMQLSGNSIPAEDVEDDDHDHSASSAYSAIMSGNI